MSPKTIPRPLFLWHLVTSLAVLCTVAGCSRPAQDQSILEDKIEVGASGQADRSHLQPATDQTLPLKVPGSFANSTAPACPRIGPGHFNGQREIVVEYTPLLRFFELSSNGHFLVTGRQTSRYATALQVWDLTSDQIIHEICEPCGVTSLAFAPDGQRMAYGTGDYYVVVWSFTNGSAARACEHCQPIGDLAFSPDGLRLATFGHDNQLILWNTAQTTVIARTISPDTRFATRVEFAGPDQIWTLSNGNKVSWYELGSNSLNSVRQVDLPDGFNVASAEGTKLYGLVPDGRLRIADATTGQILPSPQLVSPTSASSVESTKPSPQITAVAPVSSTGSIAICTTDGRLTFLNEAPQRSLDLGLPHIDRISCDRDGRKCAIHTADGNLVVLDGHQPDSRRWLNHAARSTAAVNPCFSSDNRAIASLQERDTVIVSEVKTGMTRHRLKLPQPANESPGVVTSLRTGSSGSVFCGTSAGDVLILNLGSEPTHTPITCVNSAVTAIAEHPDRQSLLIGDNNGTITWIDPHRVFPPAAQREHSGKICTLECSPDGRWVASGSTDHSIVLWEAARRSKSQVLQGHSQSVQAVNFSPDNRWIASGDRQGTVIIWDVLTGRKVWSISLSDVLVRQSTLLNSSQVDRSDSAARSSQPEQATKVSEIPSHVGITSVAFNSDQRVLAVGTASGYTQTFDLIHRRALSVVFHASSIGDMAFAPDGTSLLVAPVRGNVARWWQAPESPQVLEGHQGHVRFAALDANGQRAVTGGHDKQLRIWNVDRGSLEQTIDNDGEAIACGALTSDGRRAVTAGFGSGIVFWDLDQMKRLIKRYGHGKRVWTLAFSTDGNTVASGSDDQTVKIWDFVTQKTKHTIPLDAPVHFVLFSPNGTMLLTSTLDPRGWKFPARLQLWNVATGKEVMEYKGHPATVTSAVFDLTGSEFTSCGADGKICRWNTHTGEQISNLNRPYGLSHLRGLQGGRLHSMIRFNDGILIDSPDSQMKVAEFNVPTGSIGDLDAAFRGNRIIAGTQEGPVYVWKISDE